MKYFVSLIIGGAIAYIQNIPSEASSDFALGFKPVMGHYVLIVVFSIVAGFFVSYQQNKSPEEPAGGFWRFVDNFIVILTAAIGIGVFGVMNDNDNFMSLITPYFSFSLASGLVAGKLFFIFNNKNLTKK
ncbi:hypothetical protein [Aliikangiella sp. IMCC44359]|uniref:hypothetical protein n=1 Tax=Aliikangiella sp. IMCC44359 TaxID=3459125 RepID=UPI00403AF7BA